MHIEKQPVVFARKPPDAQNMFCPDEGFIDVSCVWRKLGPQQTCGWASMGGCIFSSEEV
jgi:hypothetical protein